MKKTGEQALKLHYLTREEIEFLQKQLLNWYKENRRDLIWRRLNTTMNEQDKAYHILVSEVMLQQTQVSTVEKYYKKWMKTWPTLNALSKATIEDVHEVWSGLGYYSRASRLLKFSQVVVEKLNGNIPTTSEELQKLPGIGRYTGGAIASIAFNKKVAAIDGNAIRVITRLHAVGAVSDVSVVCKKIWELGEKLIPDLPGDFNQGLMDFASLVCTIKNPKCNGCPLNNVCKAYTRTTNHFDDIEDCILCMKEGEYRTELGVTNYPKKTKKKPPRSEKTIVCVFLRNGDKERQYYVVKRQSSGLLANLWEFPNFSMNSDKDVVNPSSKKHLNFIRTKLEEMYSLKNMKISYLGVIPHIFSHIHQQYYVYKIFLDMNHLIVTTALPSSSKWISDHFFEKGAVSTGTKKIYSLVIDSLKDIPAVKKKKT